MKEQIIYRKVFIHGEEDLPKEKGFYFVHWKHPDDKIHTQMSVQFYDESIKGLWFGKDWYDWYLLPVPLPSDEEIKDAQDDYGQKHQEDEFGYTICSITSTAFGGGIKWLKSRLTDK